ncbi:hypothetical protein MRX96_028085 [Rhipicephalus microplus]
MRSSPMVIETPRLEAAIVRCSSSTECCQEFPAADPDRSGWNPTLQVPDSASVFDLKIPPPDLRPEIRPSRSSSEDIEALNPIVLDTTEPYQTTIMLSHADTRLPRNVSFEKAQIPSYAEATAIENLPRTSPPAVSSQHTMFAHDSSPEATGSTTSGSSAVVFMPNHELRPISFQEMAQTSSWLPRRASRCSSVHQRRWDKHQRFQDPYFLGWGRRLTGQNVGVGGALGTRTRAGVEPLRLAGCWSVSRGTE